VALKRGFRGSGHPGQMKTSRQRRLQPFMRRDETQAANRCAGELRCHAGNGD
jgi:hypothetical protein